MKRYHRIYSRHSCAQAEDTGLTKKTATATRNLGGRSMALAKDGATWALILKILLVSLLRRFQPKAVTSFELLCLAVPLPDAMARWMVRPSTSLWLTFPFKWLAAPATLGTSALLSLTSPAGAE